MNKFWTVPFLLMVGVSILGVLIPPGAVIDSKAVVDPGNIAWMLCSTALVLLMTPGLAFFYGGMVSAKNVISTMLQSFISMGVISLLWILVGFSLAFGDSIGGFIGDPRTFFMFQGVGEGTHPTLGAALVGANPSIPLLLFALFQLKFAIITPALITGSFAERVRFSGYLLFICLFSLLIYCPLAHMAWHPDGILFKWGVLDFAGGTVVHISAGLAALVGAMFLKQRKSHIEKVSHSPANIPFVILGTGLLWFGWFGFNAGSALGANSLGVLAFATTNTASAAAALAWVFFDAVRGRKVSAMGACIGAVVGLVAITPAAGFVTVPSSIFIGTFASITSNIVVYWKTKTQLDDTLDVFPCHGVGGIVGMIFTAIFATEKWGGVVATGKLDLLITHLKGLGLVAGFVIGGSYCLYQLVNLLIPIRVKEEQEAVGLDMSQHGEQLITF
ncbi:MAG TPA: ammonium transporter [Cytophagaceae bacterium]